MCPSIDIHWIPIQRSPITTLCQFQPPLLKIDVPQLRMMVRFVQVMNLGLEFFEPPAIMRPRQFKSGRRRRSRAIYNKIIKQRRKTKTDKNEERPNPFTPPNRI